MRKYYFRRLKSRASVSTQSRFNVTYMFRILFIILVTVFLLTGLVYVSVYQGYQSKLIQDIENIPSEYKQATIILDKYSENDSLLLAFLDQAYEARKFTQAKIYSLDGHNEESLKAIIKKFPSNRVEFELDLQSLSDICKDMKESYSDKKTIVISTPDLSIRTANICNNYEVLVIPATIKDTDYLVYTVSFRTRFEELIGIFLNRL